jgi:hypothetical protein
MTFAEYIIECHRRWCDDGQRPGQYYWNVLAKQRPDLIRLMLELRTCDFNTPDVDPFYDDSKLPAFLAFVQRNW